MASIGIPSEGLHDRQRRSFDLKRGEGLTGNPFGDLLARQEPDDVRRERVAVKIEQVVLRGGVGRTQVVEVLVECFLWDLGRSAFYCAYWFAVLYDELTFSKRCKYEEGL
jgi:hypothetical protein